MSENVDKNLPPQLSDEDAELLSAYIDQMLDDSERVALERRLEQDSALQAEYEALQQTVRWLNQMPAIKAPRDFTLSAEDAQSLPRIVPRRRPTTIWISAVAAVLLAFFGIVAVLAMLGPTIGNVFEEPIAALNGSGGAGGSAQMQVAAQPTQKAVLSSAPTQTPLATPMLEQAAFAAEEESAADALETEPEQGLLRDEAQGIDEDLQQAPESPPQDMARDGDSDDQEGADTTTTSMMSTPELAPATALPAPAVQESGEFDEASAPRSVQQDAGQSGDVGAVALQNSQAGSTQPQAGAAEVESPFEVLRRILRLLRVIFEQFGETAP